MGFGADPLTSATKYNCCMSDSTMGILRLHLLESVDASGTTVRFAPRESPAHRQGRVASTYSRQKGMSARQHYKLNQ